MRRLRTLPTRAANLREGMRYEPLFPGSQLSALSLQRKFRSWI